MTDFLVAVYIGAAFILVFVLFGYVMDGKLMKAGVCNTLSACAPNPPKPLHGVPRLILDVVLLTVLTPVLTLATAAVAGPETEKSLGIYGDWRAYRLEDGGLQVCYAEITLIAAPGADPALSAVRFQASNRAFNPGTDLVRFTITQTLPHDHIQTLQLIVLSLVPKGSISLAALLALEEYDLGGPIDEQVVDDMKSGGVTEVTLTQYSVNRLFHFDAQRWEIYRNGVQVASFDYICLGSETCETVIDKKSGSLCVTVINN